MAGGLTTDDVIRIRIDVGSVVQDFIALLQEQRAHGETRAPENPANRALFRELAPFRLLEYAYVDPGVGEIEGVYLGFSGRRIYAVDDIIPDSVVDQAVAGTDADPSAVYVYVVLATPSNSYAIDHFLKALSAHMSRPLVGVFRNEFGQMRAHAYDGENPGDVGANADRLRTEMVKSVLEADRHFGKARLLSCYAAAAEGGADGRAWAQLTYAFGKHVVEFPTVLDRNDFVAWWRVLCEWVYARWCSWEDLGFAEVLRPAEIAPAPTPDIPVTRLLSPLRFKDGQPWEAFGGISAETARSPGGTAAEEDWTRSLQVAREYWAYVRDTITLTETQAAATRRKPLHID